jgi:hypothetical protein
VKGGEKIKKQTIFLATTLIFAFILCGAVSAADESFGSSVNDPTTLTTEQPAQVTQDADESFGSSVNDPTTLTTEQPAQVTPDIALQPTEQVQAPDPSGIVIFSENLKLDPAEKPLYNAQINEQTNLSTWILNNGPNEATGLYVKLEIPDGLQYVDHISRQADGSYSKTAYNPTTGIWNIGTMTAKSSWNWQTDTYPYMYLTVRAIKPGTYINTATAYSNNYPTKSWSSTLIVNPTNPPQLPDLTPTNIQLPPNPITGNSYQITTTVTNIGQTAANNFNTKLYDGTTEIDQKTNSLTPGTSTTLSFTWTPTTTGTHTLKAQIDTNNQITESNENNNQITTTTTVNPTNNNGSTGIVIFSENYTLDPAKKTVNNAQINE